MTNTDVVKKLIGELNPIGETSEDNARYENLRQQCIVIEELLLDINRIATYKTRHEYSVKRAGVFAQEFLESLKKI